MDIRISHSNLPAPALLKPESQTRKPDTPQGETFREVLAGASTKPGSTEDAAKQFEALMIGQVLKAAREASSGGWLGSDEDQTGELTLEMAEQSFAQAMAARGGLGIAKLVTAQLESGRSKAASSGQAPRPEAPTNKDSGR